MEIMYVERRASRKSETMVLKTVVKLRLMGWMILVLVEGR